MTSMELPRFTIRDSHHKAVHEAYVRPLEKREAELSAALRDALASFKCTQRPDHYAPDHWSTRAAALLANNTQPAPATKSMKEPTLADHAEAWHSSNGGTVPPRDTPEWMAMYERWHAFAFENFHASKP